MNRILLLVFTLSLFSCSSKQETKDAAFWRMKYEALDSYVKQQGLKAEADKAIKEYETALSMYHFSVCANHYTLNGVKFKSPELRGRIASLKGKKNQKINITTKSNARHQDLLSLMNELSLAGYTNFNLSNERNIQTSP